MTVRDCTFLGAAQGPVGPEAAGCNFARQASRTERRSSSEDLSKRGRGEKACCRGGSGEQAKEWPSTVEEEDSGKKSPQSLSRLSKEELACGCEMFHRRDVAKRPLQWSDAQTKQTDTTWTGCRLGILCRNQDLRKAVVPTCQPSLVCTTTQCGGRRAEDLLWPKFCVPQVLSMLSPFLSSDLGANVR